jgi:hypothetical protein
MQHYQEVYAAYFHYRFDVYELTESNSICDDCESNKTALTMDEHRTN